MQIRIFDTIQEMKAYLGFTHDGIILENGLDVVENETDLFERKRRDAEVMTYLAANNDGKFVEIGTSFGHGTFRLATNIRNNGRVYTVNLLPEQATQEEKLVTHFLDKDEIGSFYREHGLGNIDQIYANTLTWDVPEEISDVSLVFVDGCHDKEFVYSDTKKLYPRIKDGGYIMWHDFNPILRNKFGWINEVMQGVEKFISENHLDGEIVHLRNSWIGIYRKPAAVAMKQVVSPQTRPALKQFTFPIRMKSLRYLMAYTAHDLPRQEEEEGYIARLRKSGYDVEGFCVSVPGPGHPHWFFDRLDHEYRNRNPPLMEMYHRLAARLQEKDVFILWTGAMVHPDFVAQLPTYNVYVCSDDPDSSDHLSRPVAPSFDYAFTRNIACPDLYRSWGCRNVKWLSPPVSEDLLFTGLTEEKILSGERDLDLVMFCERLYQGSDRAQRIEKLIAEFPQTLIRGKGWPGGFCSQEEMTDLYRRAKIGWNLHNSIGPTNSRLMTLPAFGILQICDNKKNLGRIFELDREVVGFETLDECIEKTHYYLAHEAERRQIAAAGWKRAMTDYTEERQWERLLAAIGEECLHKLGLEEPAPATAVSHREAPVRLNLGSGVDYREGYINIDLTGKYKADIRMDFTKVGERFPAGSVDEILMYHSLNYLNLWQARDFFLTALNLLAPGGRLVIETVNLENAIAQITRNVGCDSVAYMEGVRALHAFGMDQIERRESFTPYAFSWSPWHLENELRQAGFADVSILPPQTHAPWRDMRIEAKKEEVRQSKKRTVLFVLDTAMGHATAQVRGLALTESLTRSGWDVAVVDVRSTPLQNIVDQARSADIAYLLKISFIEIVKALKSTTAKVVFDLSDALWTDFHRQHGWHDLDEILSTVDAVISDNPYVARYGEKFCKTVQIVPTATHVEKFAEYLAARPEKQGDAVVVGWIGSQGTAVGLSRLKGVLDRLAARHDNLEIRIVGADRTVVPDFSSPRVTLIPEYDEQRMIEEVAAFDIGIFPPPLDLEDYVVRGALKALIYMSAGVPPVCFNAGECMDVISDGITGMLASTEKEWEEKLELLITSPQLRRNMGTAARDRISSAHSLQKVTDILSSTFEWIILGREPEPAPERGPDQGIRVLAIYDIEGWAWWNRSQNIRRHLPAGITLEMRRMDQLFDHRKYDFIMIFDPYLISLVQNVPPEKIIVGCSCPKYLEQTISLVTSARCAGGFLNNQEMFRQGTLEAPNIFCCQNGVDEELFRPTTEPPEEPIACWVGNSNSVGEKGLDLIREACQRSGVRLVTLDREAFRDMESLLAQEQVRDQVYHKATFYICASVVEGTPNPALEALACGLPVISTRVGNMPEIIRDGYNGFLVDRSVEALTAAIGLLKAGNMRAMACNARQSILDGWTWQQQVAKYAAMFSTLAKERSRYVGLNSAISLGMSLLEKGEYGPAEAAFLNALKLDPQSPKARYGRILAAKQLAGNQ